MTRLNEAMTGINESSGQIGKIIEALEALTLQPLAAGPPAKM